MGLKKERGANNIFISVLSPTIFDKLSLFSDIYANEDLILMVMSYEIEIIVPCECQDKFKCAYCTLRSVQCFDQCGIHMYFLYPRLYYRTISRDETHPHSILQYFNQEKGF